MRVLDFPVTTRYYYRTLTGSSTTPHIDRRDPDMVTTSVRIHRDLHAAFKAAAAANHRTFSDQMRFAMERTVAEFQRDDERVAA